MPADPSAGPTGLGQWWLCLVRGDGDRPTRLTSVESDRYPRGELVELGREAARLQIGELGTCILDLDDDGNPTHVAVTARYAAKSPPVWFAELRESASSPPAVVLMAFVDDRVAPGTLLDDAAAADIGVASGDQVGAVRWYPASGELDQVYVQPDWRRRNIATMLIVAGATIAYARGWPTFWSDGQRTELGERLRNGRSWRDRAAELTHVAPPMTPDVQITTDDETGGHR